MRRTVPDVRPSRSDDSNEVKAPVIEKSFVFRGKNRVHQFRRQILVPDWPPLLAGAIEQIGNQLWLDLGRIEISPAGERSNRADRFSAELHRQGIRTAEIGKLRRPDVDRVSLHRVLPQGVFVHLGTVADARQISGEILRAPGLPHGNVFGCGENLRGVLKHFSGKSRVDHARVLDVVIGENAASDEKTGEYDPQDRQPYFGSEKSFSDSNAQTMAPGAEPLLSRITHYLERRSFQHGRCLGNCGQLRAYMMDLFSLVGEKCSSVL